MFGGNSNDTGENWYEKFGMGDDSNCSMASEKFGALPLATLERSLDSQLDNSNQGIPLMFKGLDMGRSREPIDKGMFNSSNSTSRKRKHDDLSEVPPSKKSKTGKSTYVPRGSTDFSDFVTSLKTTTIPAEIGDPFLLNLPDPPPADPDNSKHEQFIPFPISTTPPQTNKRWADVVQEEEVESSKPGTQTATSSDSGSSAPFVWNGPHPNATPALPVVPEVTENKIEETPAKKQPATVKKVLDPDVIANRRKKRYHQIKLGYDSQGYKNYIRAVPKILRKRGVGGDPSTPDWTDVTISKRRFDGMVRSWRKRLHDYDDLTPPPFKLR